MNRLSEQPLWLLALLPAIPILILSISAYSTLKEFERHMPFSIAQGRVSLVNCHNHGEYQISFIANDNVIDAKPAHFLLNGNCNSRTLNEQVPVWYSKGHPKYVSFIEPNHAIRYIKSEITSSIFFGYPALLAFVLIFRTLDLRLSKRKL